LAVPGPITRRHPLAALAVALVFAGGCGSDDDSKTSSTAATKPAEGRAPAALLGTYTTTLKPSDLPPNAPPELTHGSRKWKLTIANSGGIDNGPVFAVADPAQPNALESPSFGVSGDRILLHREECAAGGQPHFYENEYRYKLSGTHLTFAKVKNLCPDKVVLTILTSEPWTKTD
jgi:hypothetical protein